MSNWGDNDLGTFFSKIEDFYFGLIEGFEPKTCDVKVKKERRKEERTLVE